MFQLQRFLPNFTDRHRRLPVILIGLSLSVLILPAEANACQMVALPPGNAAESAVTIKSLLTTLWEPGAANKADSKKIFEATHSSEPAVLLAFIFNRLQHNQTRDALTVAIQLTEQHPKNIDGWIFRAYLNALVDEFDRAAVDLRSAKKQLAENTILTPAQKVNAYRRLGRLAGYLQGPVQERLNPDMLESTLVFIARETNAEELDAFNTDRETVLTRYENLLGTENEKTKIELEKQAAEDLQLEARLTKENQTIENTQSGLLEQQQRLQSEGSQRVSELSSRLGPLQSQLTSISNQIGAVQYDLQSLYASLNLELEFHPDHFSAINLISGQIRNLQGTLFSLQSNRNAIANQLQGIQSQINQTNNLYKSQVNQLESQYKKLTNTARRNQVKLSKIAGGPDLADGKKGARDSRLNALTSYYDLPVELYRQQMLDWVGD